MKTFIALIAILLSLSSLSFGSFPTGWLFYLPITIDHTKIDSDLTEWTLVFDQSFNSVLTSEDGPLDADGLKPMQDGGGDIRFSSDADGLNQLAVDVRAAVIDNDPASGELELAINVPSVSSSSDTTIYIWWGKSGETQPAVSDTYGQYNAYDSDTYMVLPFRDWYDRVAARSIDQTYAGAPSVNNDGGPIGKYAGFNPAIRRTTYTLTHGIGTGGFAVEVLLERVDDPGGGYFGICGFGTYTPGVCVELPTPRIGLYWSGEKTSPTTSWPDDSAYHHCVFYRDGSNLNFCYDGSYSSYGAMTTYFGNTTLGIGGMSANSTLYTTNMRISEFRLHKATRSVAWSKANYNNFMNVSGFFAWGVVTNAPGVKIGNKKKFGIGTRNGSHGTISF
jgi:hypothetical protein